MVANEDAIALLPGYMRRQASPGVVLVPIADARATWKLFVVWQRGKTAGPLLTLLDRLLAKTSIAAHSRNDGRLSAQPDANGHARNRARQKLSRGRISQRIRLTNKVL